jgi:hypothetical protein
VRYIGFTVSAIEGWNNQAQKVAIPQAYSTERRYHNLKIFIWQGGSICEAMRLDVNEILTTKM